jgi:hypothetical protein
MRRQNFELPADHGGVERGHPDELSPRAEILNGKWQFPEPVYRWAGALRPASSSETQIQRRRLSFANRSRAWLTLLSVICMTLQFDEAWSGCARRQHHTGITADRAFPPIPA